MPGANEEGEQEETNNRVFIGINYESGISSRNVIRETVQELGFQPVSGDSERCAPEEIHEQSMLILHNSSYAIFDITAPAGQLMELERSLDYETIKKTLVVYASRHPSQMPTTYINAVRGEGRGEIFQYESVQALRTFLIAALSSHSNEQRFQDPQYVARRILREAATSFSDGVVDVLKEVHQEDESKPENGRPVLILPWGPLKPGMDLPSEALESLDDLNATKIILTGWDRYTIDTELASQYDAHNREPLAKYFKNNWYVVTEHCRVHKINTEYNGARDGKPLLPNSSSQDGELQYLELVKDIVTRDKDLEETKNLVYSAWCAIRTHEEDFSQDEFHDSASDRLTSERIYIFPQPNEVGVTLYLNPPTDILRNLLKNQHKLLVEKCARNREPHDTASSSLADSAWERFRDGLEDHLATIPFRGFYRKEEVSPSEDGRSGTSPQPSLVGAIVVPYSGLLEKRHRCYALLRAVSRLSPYLPVRIEDSSTIPADFAGEVFEPTNAVSWTTKKETLQDEETGVLTLLAYDISPDDDLMPVSFQMLQRIRLTAQRNFRNEFSPGDRRLIQRVREQTDRCLDIFARQKGETIDRVLEEVLEDDQELELGGAPGAGFGDKLYLGSSDVRNIPLLYFSTGRETDIPLILDGYNLPLPFIALGTSEISQALQNAGVLMACESEKQLADFIRNLGREGKD